MHLWLVGGETVEEGVIYKNPIKLMIVLMNPNLVLVNITQKGKKFPSSH